MVYLDSESRDVAKMRSGNLDSNQWVQGNRRCYECGGAILVSNGGGTCGGILRFFATV